MLVSDQAKYMLAAGRNLKSIFTNMKHVTCIVHAIDKVCKEIEKCYPAVNSFIAKFQAIIDRSTYRELEYYEHSNLTVLPPRSVLTRWTTWLKSAVFMAEHFKEINNKFIVFLPEEKQINKDLKGIVNETFHKQLSEVHEFGFLINIVKELETRSLPLTRQLEILTHLEGTLTGQYLVRLKSSLSKNPDLSYFRGNLDVSTRINLAFAPLNSCEVERSFSHLTAVYTDLRRRLKEVSLKQLLVIKFNAQYGESNDYDKDDTIDISD